MGNLGGILDGTLGEEIGLFNSLFLLVNDFQSTQRVVVIVLAENLFVCAVVDITEYEPPATLLGGWFLQPYSLFNAAQILTLLLLLLSSIAVSAAVPYLY